MYTQWNSKQGYCFHQYYHVIPNTVPNCGYFRTWFSRTISRPHLSSLDKEPTLIHVIAVDHKSNIFKITDMLLGIFHFINRIKVSVFEIFHHWNYFQRVIRKSQGPFNFMSRLFTNFSLEFMSRSGIGDLGHHEVLFPINKTYT